jgi:hypothetical protein
MQPNLIQMNPQNGMLQNYMQMMQGQQGQGMPMAMQFGMPGGQFQMGGGQMGMLGGAAGGQFPFMMGSAGGQGGAFMMPGMSMPKMMSDQSKAAEENKSKDTPGTSTQKSSDKDKSPTPNADKSTPSQQQQSSQNPQNRFPQMPSNFFMSPNGQMNPQQLQMMMQCSMPQLPSLQQQSSTNSSEGQTLAQNMQNLQNMTSNQLGQIGMASGQQFGFPGGMMALNPAMMQGMGGMGMQGIQMQGMPSMQGMAMQGFPGAAGMQAFTGSAQRPGATPDKKPSD